jgi:ABC-type branched-subunit amino acid transport system substrate-binding protein
MIRLAAAAASLAVAVPAALAASAPGVTPATITIGGTVPLSGPAAAFGAVGPGADAYFKWVNAHGGVNGRKIDYRFLDDAYDPAQTIQQTRRLVEQDHVFAIFNTVGTEHALAIRQYLNQQKVPELFAGSGVSRIAREHSRYPWTMGYLPSFFAEGVVYGRYVAAHTPRAKIAVLYENSDFGKDLAGGLRKGLGRKGKIVAQQSYEITDSDVGSQVARLRASGADTLMLFATPKFAIGAYIQASRLGWSPRVYVTSVSISPDVMAIARANSRRLTEGSISIAFVKDPTSPVWAKDPIVALYRRILRTYLPSARFDDVYNYYGMAVAFTMVDALRHAGRNPTRESLLRAATHLDEKNPFLLPGIRVKTSPSDYYPLDRVHLLRYRSGRWVLFGKLVPARG